MIIIATESQKGEAMYQTNHQKEILALFEKNPQQGYTAMAIVEQFRDTINKATIYRKLKNLEENKMIRKSFNPSKNSYEYQYSTNCENHLHLVCKECGKIIHLTCSEANEFVTHIALQHAFEIDACSTTLVGLCKECKAYV